MRIKLHLNLVGSICKLSTMKRLKGSRKAVQNGPGYKSSSRIKVVEWNQAPNGTYFPKKGSDTKAFEGNVPQSVLDSLGLK